ncbi:hypothetical protein LMG22037_00583 [Paraburkholderia phenoliruptrix]|uniref:Uncharacterized protein n=1 Tax=Paraburkholderia phenoliruptrix TaxID=252970 RepID=A0A6J4ZXD5_9BURK|nr:hypothetical protein LMG22037_00583 [Paraburkholderia phenoliruptrix]
MELSTLRRWLYEVMRVRAERYWAATSSTAVSHQPVKH